MTDAWRLTFSYEDDDFTLKSMRKLTKRVPPSHPIDAPYPAWCVELRDGKQQVLYRRRIAQLVPNTVEYPTGDPSQPLGHVAAPRAGEFAILVPAHPHGRHVVVVGTPRNTRMGGDSEAFRAEQPGGPRDLTSVELPQADAGMEGDK